MGPGHPNSHGHPMGRPRPSDRHPNDRHPMDRRGMDRPPHLSMGNHPHPSGGLLPHRPMDRHPRAPMGPMGPPPHPATGHHPRPPMDHPPIRPPYQLHDAYAHSPEEAGHRYPRSNSGMLHRDDYPPPQMP
ncbi:hypothetical protein K470DRAFT_277792 [Piedraia hortae CBS 480.64]|uniref:Uncharacterized protein n=1 Tax=Piedraia hortae CBS 480.64 TaxID=1314780 RepID=A0A6A7BX90_9PEZI|nr:hypothetical protein K470DRAFT_277792 [Piedraia hortae CBS 480.64]